MSIFWNKVRGKWEIQVFVQGHRLSRLLPDPRSRPDPTSPPREARLLEAHLKLQLQRGEVPSRRQTLEALAEAYLQAARLRCTPRGVEYLESRIPHLLRLLPARLDRLTRQVVETYRVTRSQEGVSNATINREVSVLKAMLNRAMDWEWLPRNPLTRFKPLPEPPERIRYLEPAQFRAILAELTLSLQILALTSCLTLLRLSELLSLRWNQFDSSALEVPVKGGRLKRLPLTLPLISLLSRLPRLGPWVFTNPTTVRPYTSMGVKASWRRACRRAGIEDFRFHDLRHQGATLLYELGYDEGMIKRIGGWRSTAVMERYRHGREPLVVDALQALGNTFVPYLTPDASTNQLTPVDRHDRK
ncbi:MAG: site-specific integrase [candidate division NC10 bacterium]|nr:site-specific integrase [candidate division NC10 bacterium]